MLQFKIQNKLTNVKINVRILMEKGPGCSFIHINPDMKKYKTQL